jgi:hypothetical protein
METKQQPWLACYIYRPEPWESLLTEHVGPFARSVLKEGLAEQYFFIRYWERGPHIRLRFKGERRRMDETVRPKLDQYFSQYFSENPSDREEPEAVASLPEERQWFPNDSVQYIEYEPETARYGGPVGLEISERQFQISSDTVLAVMEDRGEWDYERAMGAAIQLHLGFAYALGMDLPEAISFYTRISKLWLARAFGYIPGMAREEVEKRKEATLAAFAENFEKQKEVLVPFHQAIWEAFTDNVSFEQEWLNHWIEDMREIGHQLKSAQGEDKLEFPPSFTPDPNSTIPRSRQLLWVILESYVHMTNNRLGILNRDEAFLGHLIHQSLLHLAPEG